MFFVLISNPFLKTGLTSATFNSVGKIDVNKVLLNSFAKVSEHISSLALRIFGGYFFQI